MNITSHKIKAKVAQSKADLWYRRISQVGAAAKIKHEKWTAIAKWHREQIRLLRQKHAKN